MLSVLATAAGLRSSPRTTATPQPQSLDVPAVFTPRVEGGSKAARQFSEAFDHSRRLKVDRESVEAASRLRSRRAGSSATKAAGTIELAILRVTRLKTPLRLISLPPTTAQNGNGLEATDRDRAGLLKATEATMPKKHKRSKSPVPRRPKEITDLRRGLELFVLENDKFSYRSAAEAANLANPEIAAGTKKAISHIDIHRYGRSLLQQITEDAELNDLRARLEKARDDANLEPEDIKIKVELSVAEELFARHVKRISDELRLKISQVQFVSAGNPALQTRRAFNDDEEMVLATWLENLSLAGFPLGIV